MRVTRVLGSFLCVVVPILACGGADDVAVPEFPDPSVLDGGTGSRDGAIIGNPLGDAGFMACALHIVLSLDISGSMCESVEGGSGRDCSSPVSKWQQTRTALKAFFSSPDSKDSLASVMPWPSVGTQCNVNSAPMTPADVQLPDTGNTLDSALNAQTPNNGGTPTAQAINAAVAHAQALKAKLTDNGNVVVILATDGEPFGCTSNLNDAVSAATAAKAAGYAPYVIGVGPSLNNLNQIAAGAGTNMGKAFLVAANVSVSLNMALNEIKKKSLSCNLQIPTPTSGTINFKKVNLTFKPTGGTERVLVQSQDCSNPDGWKYTPDANAPTGIELCSAACGTIRAADTGALNVVLGCDTQGGPR
jgi:von Willebrand factor type A domain